MQSESPISTTPRIATGYCWAPAHLRWTDKQWKSVLWSDVLEQHMLPSEQCLFLGRPLLFQQDIVEPKSARVTKMWIYSKRVWVLY